MRCLTLLLIPALILCSTSCNKKSHASEEVIAMILTKPGSWKVSKLVVGIIDKSSEFEGYNFVFTGDGKVNATFQSTNVQGTWKVYYDTPDNPGSSNTDERKFMLSFPPSEKLDLISVVWHPHDVGETVMSFNNGEFVLTKN